MDSRGAQTPKSLRIVDVSAGSTVGETIQDADGNDVGTITSISGTLGLGYIKRGVDVGRAPQHMT
jgi:gamma-glutamyltranspeptidase